MREEKRKKKPVTYVLPVDIIQLIDDCARRTGLPKSTFLQLFLDAHKALMISFAKGLVVKVAELEELLSR